jgi:hypothetical protein
MHMHGCYPLSNANVKPDRHELTIRTRDQILGLLTSNGQIEKVET